MVAGGDDGRDLGPAPRRGERKVGLRRHSGPGRRAPVIEHMRHMNDGRGRRGGERADHTADTTEDQVRKLEVKGFMALLKTEGTLARVEHMLETGRPLRN